MKKHLKTALILCMIMLSVSCLTSCVLLDNIKSTMGEWVDDEHKSIMYCGKEYRLLDNPRNCRVIYSESAEFYPRDKGYPLFILRYESRLIGTYNYYYPDIDIIDIGNDYYASESNYDEYSELFLNGDFESYIVFKNLYDKDNNCMVLESKFVSRKVMNVVLKTAEKGTPSRSGESTIQLISIHPCDSNGKVYSNDNILVKEKRIERDSSSGKFYTVYTSEFGSENHITYEDIDVIVEFFEMFEAWK